MHISSLLWLWVQVSHRLSEQVFLLCKAKRETNINDEYYKHAYVMWCGFRLTQSRDQMW